MIADGGGKARALETPARWVGTDRSPRARAIRLSIGTRAAIAVILALAVGLRVLVYLDAPHPFEGAGLAAQQSEIARNIVDHGQWFAVNRSAYRLLRDRQIQEQRLVDPGTVDFATVDRRSKAEPAVDQMPGVGVVLAGLWWATGRHTYAAIQWLQILLDSALALLVYWIARRLAGSERVGLFAALLYAVWPGAIVVAKRPVLDTWAGFFVIGCTAAFLWARERPERRSRLVFLGLLAGTGLYFRPLILLLPIALALVATPGGGWRRRLLWTTLPTLAALTVLAPWTIRNYYEFDRFIPTRSGLGQAVFEGIGATPNDAGAAEYVKKQGKDAKYGSPAYDEFLLKSAARAIRDDPGAYLRRVGRRARLLVPCLLALIAWRRWRSAALLPVAVAAGVILPYLLIGDDTRFYLPAAFAYLVLVAMVAEMALSAAARRLRA